MNEATHLDDDALTTAFHEAGHAWALVKRGHRVQQVTICPPDAEYAGLTVPHRAHIWTSTNDFTLAAGTIAETEFAARSGALGRCSWMDALEECLFLGGGWFDRADMRSTVYVEPGPALDSLRDMVRNDWSRIEALARRTLARGTVRGPEIEALLLPNPDEVAVR